MKYQVRSKDLMDVINEIDGRRLILSPYFQRNLVWRLIHKIDFIKTILLGYPFPQIFIARGEIDIEKRSTTSCIVDGQQRMNAIKEFLNGEFRVDGRSYRDLTPQEKQTFLKYQIPIIDLDIANDDPEIIEIFQRLNRTFYSLSGIEKLSTEYAASEFMLLAKFLTKEIEFPNPNNEECEEDESMPLQIDPTIPRSFHEWAAAHQVNYYNKLVSEEGIFTPYELTRQVHLMFTLNILATLNSDFYNRNEFVNRRLNDFAEEYPTKDKDFLLLENAANKFLKLKLKKKSYWYNKANAFSLISFFIRYKELIDPMQEIIIKQKLEDFERDTPNDYKLAAKEGVNNKQERLLRNKYLIDLLIPQHINHV